MTRYRKELELQNETNMLWENIKITARLLNSNFIPTPFNNEELNILKAINNVLLIKKGKTNIWFWGRANQGK